ncbi:trafficking protein particle complex subunit 4 [Thraustotheca clavata]|uniref:Trafficking protein particle complex subunit n=1 Tax=Thraustotheca clavata TaxID=74557 RepID=A0A1V9YSC4_9STRA|nr:trafficking protein particle complex subunit 4 [Thraustotheca clavata]
MLLALYVINKAGGLIYHQDLSAEAPRLNSNDHLRLGSTFHSIHAIAGLAAPLQSKGIVAVDTDAFRLRCFQALTGTKFFVTALPAISSAELEAVLRQIYEIYADYVLKNPFYELEMPIRCSLFNANLKLLVDRVNARPM